MKVLRKGLFLSLLVINSNIFASGGGAPAPKTELEQALEGLVYAQLLGNPDDVKCMPLKHLIKFGIFMSEPWQKIKGQGEGKQNTFHIRMPEGWILSVAGATDENEESTLELKKVKEQIYIRSKTPLTYWINGVFQRRLHDLTVETAGNELLINDIGGYNALIVGSGAEKELIYDGLCLINYIASFLLIKNKLIKTDEDLPHSFGEISMDNGYYIAGGTHAAGTRAGEYEAVVKRRNEGKPVTLRYKNQTIEVPSETRIPLPEPEIKTIGADYEFTGALDYDFVEEL